jgi:hypothetical protein
MLWIFFIVRTVCDYLCREFLFQKQNLPQKNCLNHHNELQYSEYQSQDCYAPSETYKIRLRKLHCPFSIMHIPKYKVVPVQAMSAMDRRYSSTHS